jgi:hypothetical protein
VPFHLQIDLLNGQSVNLNTCNALSPGNGNYYTYQYITSINNFYDKQGTLAAGKLFDPSGSSPCTVSGYFTTFLYYMKKQ